MKLSRHRHRHRHRHGRALATLKALKASNPALWVTIASLVFLASAQPSANGLDFPMTTRLTLPASKNLTVATNPSGASLSAQIAEMALVATLSRQVELARTIKGAKDAAQLIMAEEYGWGDHQFECLDSLWTRESHWNYKAHNYRSGAHGIPQALPAVKMEVVSSDWRTNPVTQVRWGLRYIDIRYISPCKAWSKFKRSNYY